MNNTTENNPSHSQVWELIPWLVNGTATAAQHATVAAHVQHCADCRGELALQQRFRAAMQADTVAVPDARRGLQALLARIDAAPQPAGAAVAAAAVPARSWTPWLAAAIVVQALGLVLLGSALLLRAPASRYSTLSQATAPAGPAVTLRLVPSPDMTLATLRQLLAQHELQVVQSNADGSILGLATRAASPSPQALAETLTSLRASPGVLLAEPVLAPSQPAAVH